MKKFLISFSIVAIVIGAHVILLKNFIFPAKKQPVAEEVKTPEQIDKGRIPEPIPQIAKGPVFKPYNYRGAIIGDLQAIPTSKFAGAGILVDLSTRQVLWAKNPRKSVAIASMTKMLTELIVFEELEKRKDVTLETPIQVTVPASKIGGSQIYLDPRESFPLEDLLKAVMISSANDAAYLVAEYFGNGDVNAFVEKMNIRAKELKLPGAKFFNPHGLGLSKDSSEDNMCSVEGCVILGERLLEVPKAAEFARTKSTNIRENTAKPFTLFTHNHLLGVVPGVNGMKTGYIERSGFCITVTADRNGRKMAACVTGFKERKGKDGRDAFVAKLIDWGYKQKPVETAKTDEPLQAGNEDKNLDDLLNQVVPK